MQILAMLLLTLVALAAALYTHYRIPYHTSSARDRWLIHVFLAATAAAFGWVVSQQYPISGLLELLVFLSAFGVVHVPAAGILFIKRQQKKSS